MREVFVLGVVLSLLPGLAWAAEGTKEQERVKDAGEVLKEILNIPDDIPQDLLDKAECVVCFAVGEKGRIRDRRQLRPRSHGLP